MDLNLRGRTALVTGASKGIGCGAAESSQPRASTSFWCRARSRPRHGARQHLGALECERSGARLDISDSANVDRLRRCIPISTSW